MIFPGHQKKKVSSYICCYNVCVRIAWQLERWQCLAGVHARAASRGGEGERLLAALLDLATLSRVLGRLAPALLAGKFDDAH